MLPGDANQETMSSHAVPDAPLCHPAHRTGISGKLIRILLVQPTVSFGGWLEELQSATRLLLVREYRLKLCCNSITDSAGGVFII